MKWSLREMSEARAALSCAFECLWPDPACPCVMPSPCPEDLDALEQRYRRAQRTVKALGRNAAAETSIESAGSLIERTD